MATGLRPFTESLIITVLVGVLILTFALTFLGGGPNSNYVNHQFYNDAILLNKSMTDFNNLANTIKGNDPVNGLGTAQPTPIISVFLIFQAAFNIPKYFLGGVYNGIAALTTVMNDAFGAFGTAVSIAIAVLVTILVIRLVLLIIQTIRTGQSER